MSYKEKIDSLITSKSQFDILDERFKSEIKSLVDQTNSEFDGIDWEFFDEKGFNKKEDYCFIYSYPPVRALGKKDGLDFSSGYLTSTSELVLNLYLHIPYCTGICNYCYFAKVLDNKNAPILRQDYPAMLEKEFELFRAKFKREMSISSIHFGGGTPSLLKDGELEYIFSFLKPYLKSGIEITMECAPETILENPDRLESFKRHGINRLNLGVESLDNRVLKLMGRRHDRSDTLKALELMQDYGFDNINVDIIYGLPGQSLESWLETLLTLNEYNVQSVSTYRLRKHPKKHISSMPKDVFPSYEDSLKMQLAHGLFFKKNGFVRSSSHKYAKTVDALQKQVESKRGVKSDQLLALGCGAYGYLENSFYWNTKSLSEYSSSLLEGRRPTWLGSSLTVLEQMHKAMVLGIHTNKGVSIDDFISRFGTSPVAEFSNQISELVHLGLLETSSTHIKLTEIGRFFSDEISVYFYSNDVKDLLYKEGMKYGMFFLEDKYV